MVRQKVITNVIKIYKTATIFFHYFDNKNSLTFVDNVLDNKFINV